LAQIRADVKKKCKIDVLIRDNQPPALAFGEWNYMARESIGGFLLASNPQIHSGHIVHSPRSRAGAVIAD